MRIGIFGYGNLGRGVETAMSDAPDLSLSGIFTRRDPALVESASGAPVYPTDRLAEFRDKIDVLILCAGSATDLPRLTPRLARDFDIVDGFDTHSSFPDHFERTDRAASSSGHLALVGCGWDPGLFSLARLILESVLPRGTTHTFWGRGISQGHSDAIRHIEGVLDARQYTVPIPKMISAARAGDLPPTSPTATHRRECYVTPAGGADLHLIEERIKRMPDYFDGYDTSVSFIPHGELLRLHGGMPHGGRVIRHGKTASHSHTAELSLDLGSNPEFTASVILAYSRAVFRLRQSGRSGALTVLDIPPALLSPLSPDEQRKRYI